MLNKESMEQTITRCHEKVKGLKNKQNPLNLQLLRKNTESMMKKHVSCLSSRSHSLAYITSSFIIDEVEGINKENNENTNLNDQGTYSKEELEGMFNSTNSTNIENLFTENQNEK